MKNSSVTGDRGAGHTFSSFSRVSKKCGQVLTKATERNMKVKIIHSKDISSGWNDTYGNDECMYASVGVVMENH